MASSVALALPSTQLSENVERCYNGGTVKEHRGASLDVTTSQKKKKKSGQPKWLTSRTNSLTPMRKCSIC